MTAIATHACAVCLRAVDPTTALCECGHDRAVPVETDYPAEPWRQCYVTGPTCERAAVRRRV